MQLTIALSTLATLATALKTNSNPKDCTVITGSYENVQYRYFSTGRNCATTSDIGSITKDLHHQFIELGLDAMPYHRCIKYDEGGAFNGFLLYGIAGKVDLTRYCGPQMEGSPRMHSRMEL